MPVLLKVVNLFVLLLRKGSVPGELMFVGLCVYEVESKVRLRGGRVCSRLGKQ